MTTVPSRRLWLRTFTLAMTLVLAGSLVPVQARQPDRPVRQDPTVRAAEKHDSLASLKGVKVKGDKKSKIHEATPLRKLPKAKGKGKFGPTSGGGGAKGGPGAGSKSPTGLTPSAGAVNSSALAAPVAPGMPAFDANFEGVPNVDFVLPPDTNGDIGPNHYMQWVNLSFQVFDRSGNPQLPTPDDPAPQPGNALFAGFGGICEDTNWGDPIVQYDHLAGRWMASQFALFGEDGNHQCIAVSQTDDPTGGWYRYDFLISATKLNDYPKFGVWPDAYYMSINQFDQNTLGWAGAGAVAFERDQMLLGQPANMVYFDLFDVDQRFGGMLPSDLDGLTLPPTGAPNLFAEADDDAFGFPQDQFALWEFHVDWDEPLNSTFGIAGQPNTVIATDPFEMEICGFAPCIPQPGTDQTLDQISDRLMYRLQYRNFGDRQTLVTNHTVDVDGNDHAGVRWYILENTGSGWGIQQQGDLAPDSTSRWMASAALDATGNLALGYTASSKDIFPSIRTAGRLALDPTGTLPQPEGEMMTGGGSQLHPAARWGDYSSISLDPLDDCTFWYTSEYLPETSDADWHTRIGSFKYPSCTTGPRGTIVGTVTTSPSGDPLAGAQVEVGGLSTITDATGHYAILVPADTYEVSASSYGFRRETVPGVVVGDGATVTVDFELDPLPETVVSGIVTDAGHGWPLYARIDVGGAPIDPLFTDPMTGAYQVTLFQETDYVFKVNGLVGSYLQQTRPVTAAGPTGTEDFALAVDQTRCAAPGYELDVAGLYETFPVPAKPAGWLNIDSSPAGGQGTWRFDDPAGKGNLTGGEGDFAIIDSDWLGPDFTQDAELWTSNVDLTGIPSPSVIFRTDFFEYSPNDQERGPEVADVDLSIDGGSTWSNIWHETSSKRGPRLVTIPIPTAGGEPDARVRFHYYNANFEWWWQVDDVIVGTRDCDPIEGGGLLVGHVTDANTSDPIDGAMVASDDAPADTTTSFPTPADPGQGDGLYVLYSSLTGEHPFTASRSNYTSDTDPIDVAPGTTTAHDFSLGAGQLTATPNPLEVTLPMGGTTDEQLTLTNTGGAAAAFELRERDAGREILAAAGAPKRVTKGIYSPHSYKLGKSPAGRPRKIVHPPLVPPWTGVADYPILIEAPAAGALDGKVYSVGGFSDDIGDFVSDGYVYDPAANSWSPIAGLSVAREAPAGAMIDDHFYVAGGWAGNNADPTPVLEIYDPATDTWSTGAENPAPYAASGVAVLDGLLYLVGGCPTGFSCGADTVTVYDPASDSWAFAAPYPEPTSWTSCGAVDALLYCAGGVSDDFGDSSSAYVYDPAADAWSPIASLPITMWGSGYVGANGLLLVSGGAGDGDITNVGYSYDPGTDMWSPLPNSNITALRGGSTCGFYRIGGFGNNQMLAEVDVLPGFDECGGGGDVLWLSETPVEGSVPAGGNQPIAVHFDASVEGIDQPGAYRAQITVKEDTPYTTTPVDVVMNITPPAGWGKLAGTVTGLERCDAGGAPLSGATVDVDGDATDFSLKTDADGAFKVWMPATNGPVSIHVSKGGYVAADASGVNIPADGSTTTRDFTLRLDAPCASVAPASIDVTLTQGGSTDATVDLGNTGGAAGYDFAIAESPFDLGTVNPALPLTRAFSDPVAIGSMSIRSFVRPAKPTGAAPSPALPPWLGGAPLPGGAVRYAHAQCDGDPDRFYAIGGVDSNFGVTNQAARFDSAANSWTVLAPIPQGAEGATGVCIAGRIHVLGGDGTDMHWVYDIAADSWAAGAPVPRGVAGATAAGWAGRIYLAGGSPNFDPSGATDQVDIYDIASDTWIGTASAMPDGTAFSGYAQAAQYLYVAGGYDQSGGYDANVVASQRYDLTSDTWTSGPDLATGRADFALAATNSALYAMGGDTSGGTIFEPGDTVERLETAGWPGGSWSGYAPLPAARTANSAGYCSEGFDGGEVWSVAGANADIFITDGTFVTLTPGERCPTVRGDVPWLSVDPASGSVGPDGSVSVAVTIDASGLGVGTYAASLIVATTDPAVAEVVIPVHVIVEPAKAFISVAAAGTVGGVDVTDEDVVAIAADDTAVLYFDGSDVGLDGLAIDAFATLDDGSLLFSFTAPGTIAGVAGTVDDSDIVRFEPTSLGADTAGSFTLWFDGSDVGLTTNNEDLDAIDVVGGTLYVSTTGSASVAGIKGSNADADILAFTWTSLGATTAGTWALYADMSDVGLSGSSENLDALALVDPTAPPTATAYVSTNGTMSVPGLTADNDDVSVVTFSATGGSTAGTWASTPYIDGAALGIGSNAISAFELP